MSIETSRIILGDDVTGAHLRTASGLEIAAGCDAGIGYNLNEDGSSRPNQDRVVLCPDEDFLAVIDGMGGHGDGDLAAAILAEELSEAPRAVTEAIGRARDRMRDLGGHAGACMMTAHLRRRADGGRSLLVYSAGDVGLFILQERTALHQALGKYAHLKSRNGVYTVETRDSELDFRYRNVVWSYVSAREAKVEKMEFPLELGERLFMFSDGVGNNLTLEEMAKLGEGKSVCEHLHAVWNAVGERMEKFTSLMAAGRHRFSRLFPDGRRAPPKPDNRSLIVGEYRPEDA